jgi:DNA-binding transcriptional LysR family regulator
MTEIALRQIRAVIAVCEEGSFTRAAVRENSTQSGISQHVAAVEQSLGIKLFERSASGVKPTPAGWRYYKRCIDAVSQIASANDEVRAFASRVSGDLRVGLMPTLTRAVLTPALGDHSRRRQLAEIRRRRRCRRLREEMFGSVAAPALGAKRQAPLAHGDVVAETLPGSRHVGGAHCRAYRRSRAAGLKSRYRPRARSCRPSRCSTRSAPASPRWATPRRSTGRARSRRRRSSPRCRSGLLPNEHVAWIDAGGGQALWDELYAPFGVKPFMGGNTGVCMGGWFRREIKSRDDVRGLKIRSLGLGGEVYRRLGAIPQTTSPGEILVALQSGVIDGAEFVGPGSDIALGLYRFAPFYYGPGFNKPNGTGECIVGLQGLAIARRRD